MAFRSKADGITKSGKTKGKQIGRGSMSAPPMSPKLKTPPMSTAMKAMGRNMARARNQKRGG